MLRQFLSFSPSRVIKCLSRLNDKEVSFTKSRQRILFLTAAGLLIVGGGWLLYSTGFFQAASSQESLRAYIDDFAPYSHLCFFLLQFLSVVLAPIPSNITAAAGGVLFGTWPSFFLTFAAVVAGSLLLFWLARVLGRDFAGRFVSRRLSEKYQQILQTKAPVFLTLAFLFPFFPDDLLCILAGLSSLSFRRFAVIVLLARPWGLLFASALGGAAFHVSPWAMVLIGVAGLVLFLLGMKYGDQIEAAILKRLSRWKGNDAAC